MCTDCDWEDWLDTIACALDDVDLLPERADEFAESVRDKLEGIAEWVGVHEHITGAQKEAVENMAAAISRWSQV